MKVAMVTTWRVPCGVGKYTEELCNSLQKLCELKIFAEKTEKELEQIDPSINFNYERTYIRGGSYDESLQKILEFKPDIVHVQFESSMYQESYNSNGLFTKFLNELHSKQIKTILTLHNVLPFPNFISGEIQQISSWYNDLNSEIIVGNEAVKNEFLKWTPTKSANIIPLGSTIFDPISKEEALQKLGLPNKIYIVQAGFYGADKGMIQLVKAMFEILPEIPDVHMVFAGGLHPQAPDAWKVHTKECIKSIIKNNLTKSITMLGRFVPENELNIWLGASNIIMLNYHWVSGLYSASASGHRVLCANRPIIMNSQDVRLSEFVDGVNCCKTDDDHLKEAITKCLIDNKYSAKISQGAVDYAHETSFDKIAQKHMEVYKK